MLRASGEPDAAAPTAVGISSAHVIAAPIAMPSNVLREIRIGKIARLGSSDVRLSIAKSPCVGAVPIAKERIGDAE